MNKEKYLYWSALLFCFVMPFSTPAGNIALGLFLFMALLNADYKRKYSKLQLKVLIPTTAIFFVAYFFGFMGSLDIPLILNEFGKKIFYLIVPIAIFLLPPKKIETSKFYGFKGLVIGCFLSSILLLGNNFYSFYLTRPFYYFDKDIFDFYYTGYSFTSMFDIHPSYFGSYLVLALVYLLYKLNNANGIRIKVLIIGIILTYLTTIIFLNSRMILGLCFVAICVFLIKNVKHLLSKKLNIIALGTIVLFLFLGYRMLKDTYVFAKATNELKWDLSNEVESKYNFSKTGDSRLARWKCGMEVIKKSPILGHGLNSERAELVKIYESRNMKASIVNRYDSHNQMMSFYIQFGLVGFLILIVYFLSNFLLAIKSKDVVFLAFQSIVFFICLSENYLNRNAAIIFVSFFGSVLLLSYYKKHVDE